MFNKYPYTDFHEMNLDYILNEYVRLKNEILKLQKKLAEIEKEIKDMKGEQTNV